MIECKVIDQEGRSVAMNLHAKPAIGEVVNLRDGWGVVKRLEHSDGKPPVIYIDKARLASMS